MEILDARHQRSFKPLEGNPSTSGDLNPRLARASYVPPPPRARGLRVVLHVE